MSPKMHSDEVEIDEPLVRRRLQAEFPHWAHLPLRPVLPWGTDNAMFRLGMDMVVRMPRVAAAARQVEKEQVWLPRLAPGLPLAIPRPLGHGAPSAELPWAWSIYSWLDGVTVDPAGDLDFVGIAAQLGEFVAALQALDAADGPAAGRHNFGRGVPLATRDRETRRCLASLADTLDVAAALRVWEDALEAPVWRKDPVWVHGDLQAANLLMTGARLSAVIDFGGLGVGDPACDLIIAWSLFSGEARERYRAALDVDAATWRRGRGWALSVAAIALPYYRGTNPRLVDTAERSLRALLAEPVGAVDA